jgi:phosphoserine phosphatase RsbU/P
MIPLAKTASALLSPSARLWRSLFSPPLTNVAPVDPLHCGVPELRNAEIAAVYLDQRRAGDFYEFLRVSRARVLFALLDMAGRRADTRATLIAAQSTFRTLAPNLFAGDDLNEATAMMKLCYSMNATVLAGGVRSCPAFLGCYNEDLGTVCYASAGHTPALLWDGRSVALLESTGLPLGLFSHTVQSATTCHLVPGAALVAVSRGVVEAESEGAEFGLEGAVQALESRRGSARECCLGILKEVQNFLETTSTQNDMTVLTLLRSVE